MTDPSPRVYFLLQRAAHRLQVAADRKSLAAAKVTTAQLAALVVIGEKPGCTQRYVADVLGQGESGINTMVTRLVTAGLVIKSPHPTQHRAIQLDLTTAGSEALAATATEMVEFNRRVREALGPHLADTAAGLEKLLEVDL